MRSLSQSKIYERISESVRRAKEACRWKYWPKAKNGFNLCKKEKQTNMKNTGELDQDDKCPICEMDMEEDCECLE